MSVFFTPLFTLVIYLVWLKQYPVCHIGFACCVAKNPLIIVCVCERGCAIVGIRGIMGVDGGIVGVGGVGVIGVCLIGVGGHGWLRCCVFCFCCLLCCS